MQTFKERERCVLIIRSEVGRLRSNANSVLAFL